MAPLTSADNSSSPEQALCHALITAEDLPSGFDTTSAPPKCDDPHLQATGFGGQKIGLQSINEELERTDSVENAVSRLPQLISELNMMTPEASEQNSAEFRELGDEVRYFTEHADQTYWNVLYIRRGKLLMYLSVTKYGPFTPADMHLFGAKAVKRAASLG